MMGSCAFLMPVASLRFIRFSAFSMRAALGLTLGGIPGVLIAAYIVKSLPLVAVRWLVVIVVIYAAVAMLRSAAQARRNAPTRTSRSGRRIPKPLNRNFDRGCRRSGRRPSWR